MFFNAFKLLCAALMVACALGLTTHVMATFGFPLGPLAVHDDIDEGCKECADHLSD